MTSKTRPVASKTLRIGLSYDQATPKYRLYADALFAAGERYRRPVEAVWLAGLQRRTNLAAIAALDGIVMTGGADVDPWRYGFDDRDGLCIHALPERDETELLILDAALNRTIPMLAICRGMQLLNVSHGGTLIPDLPGHEIGDELRHPVRIEQDSRLAEIAGTGGNASTSHHQAVDRPGSGLRVVAKAPDGIVEAIEWEHPDGKPWLAAVQWHPERMALDEPLSGSLYRAFLNECATWK